MPKTYNAHLHRSQSRVFSVINGSGRWQEAAAGQVVKVSNRLVHKGRAACTHYKSKVIVMQYIAFIILEAMALLSNYQGE